MTVKVSKYPWPPLVPMGTLPLIPSLINQIITSSTPVDDTKNHVWLRPLALAETSPRHERFQALIDYFTAETSEGRRPSDIVTLRRHWCYFLLNLSIATVQRKWILVAMSKKSYSNDAWLKRYDFRYAASKAIVDYLQDKGLVEVKPGAKYKNQPLRTRVFPSVHLQQQLIGLSLEAEEPIEPPYLIINEPEGGYAEAFASVPKSHPDKADMTTINDFLRGHRWAGKGPVRLVYKHDPFSSGRLITSFQSLPDRRIRIRINTLINDKPICEVDFNANHLRLNLAVFSGEDAGETPYEDIGEIAGIDNRGIVKTFITIAMGASTEGAAEKACRAGHIDRKSFELLKTATLRRYPSVLLFKGFGIHAQSLEGQILKDVMLAGVTAGKIVLPVHDAVAVVQDDAAWAKEQMLEAWGRHANCEGGTARARLKIDLPDRSEKGSLKEPPN